MLNHFVQPATLSTGSAVDGLQPIKGYLPQNQMASLLPSFQLPDEGGKTEDEQSRGQSDNGLGLSQSESDRVPNETFRLMVDPGFQEMIRLFLIPDHDKILSIRSRMRQERGVNELTFYIPVGMPDESLHENRKELYEVQLQLFKTPKGLHFHIII